MSYKTVWKLCYRRDSVYDHKGRLFSAVAYDSDVSVEYRIGEIAKPKVGLLFAFKTREDAIKGRVLVNGGAVLVRCKALVSKRLPPPLLPQVNHCWDFWPRFMRGRQTFDSFNRTPPGTIFCTRVIPIEVEE